MSWPCLRTKRKSQQAEADDDDILVEWVDDAEWKAIEASFEVAISTTTTPRPCEDLRPIPPASSRLPPPTTPPPSPLPPPNSASSSMIPLVLAAPATPSAAAPVAAATAAATTAATAPASQNCSKLCPGCQAAAGAAALPREIPERCWCVRGKNLTSTGGAGGRGDGSWGGNGGWGGFRSWGDSGLRSLQATTERRERRNLSTSDGFCWAARSAAEQNHLEFRCQANGSREHEAEVEKESDPAEAPAPVQNSVAPSNPEEGSDNGAKRDEDFSQQASGMETDVDTGERASEDSAAAVQERSAGGRRQLPAWMQTSREIGQPPSSSGSSIKSNLASGDYMGSTSGPADQEAVGGRPSSRLEEGVQESRASIAQQQLGINGGPSDSADDSIQQPLEQPQGLPWGLQPSSFVDNVKPKFPTMQFRGQIVYSKTESEVNVATLELWHRVRELQETTQGVVPIGFDLEWKASFERGEIPRKVAVMQLCLDGRRCDVMHIFYSGIPLPLQSLLEAPSTLKVGLGIHGDVSKLHHDYRIRTEKVADLRDLAKEKMRTMKQWSLSSLALELTGRQIEKDRNIRCGDWEALPLSEPQLRYAATDAFASLHLHQVLGSFPSPAVEGNQSDRDGGTTAVG